MNVHIGWANVRKDKDPDPIINQQAIAYIQGYILALENVIEVLDGLGEVPDGMEQSLNQAGVMLNDARRTLEVLTK
jgi:hypothetical protein